jgi:S-adenosylmethionine/arginine decarboxylase-like enzyme
MRRPHQHRRDGFTYGVELVMDLDECDLGVITDADRIREFAKRLVEHIKMRPYGEPVVEHFGHDDPITSGYTLVQLIETSSIVAHFSDALRRAHVNVFSCRAFDPRSAMDFTETFLGAQETTYTVLSR